MIISPKYKFIFIKTQKTAGSSIEKILLNKISDDNNLIFGGMPPENMEPINLPQDYEHASAHVGKEIIKREFPNEWNNYFKFTVERNSWDKTASLYYWGKHLHPSSSRFGGNFDDFIFHKKNPYLPDWLLYTKNNKPVVDFIMQYDNLNNDFRSVLDILKLPYNNELENTKLKSGHRKEKDYKILYTNKSKDKIRELYKNTIEYFNYSF